MTEQVRTLAAGVDSLTESNTMLVKYIGPLMSRATSSDLDDTNS